MRDEDLEVFIEAFGEATDRVEVPATSIEKWRGKLPDQLLSYWQEEGWCAYANGLFGTVDPDEYEDLLDEWLKNTKLEQLDAFHVIARSAFGNLYVCGEKTGKSITIACQINKVFSIPKELKIKDKKIWIYLSVLSFPLSSQKISILWTKVAKHFSNARWLPWVHSRQTKCTDLSQL